MFVTDWGLLWHFRLYLGQDCGQAFKVIRGDFVELSEDKIVGDKGERGQN